MNDKEFLKEMIVRGTKADEGYFEFAHIVACLLDKRLHEQLEQLVNGPIWDWDIISKSNLNELFDLGLAVRICSNGKQGYTGATYFSYSVLERIKQIKCGQVGA